MINNTRKISIAGFCLAFCIILPFFTGQIPGIGRVLAPMHIPVLLCGFLCGMPYAFFIGLIAPTLRFILLGIPPIFPIGIAMTFELATYGLVAGFLYKVLSKKTRNIYVSLIGAMIAGRVIWGIAMFVIACVSELNFSLEMFIAGAFINAIPGIICHIVIIPLIIMPLRRIGVIENG